MKLHLSSFRNLAEQEVVFRGGLNLLTGENGQGKSSLLEAVYLLGTTRSFRTTRLAEVVGRGTAGARVAGTGASPGEGLAVMIQGRTRSYLRHGKSVGAAEYLGAMDVVALSSELVMRFGRIPAERRRFLDRMALATWPACLREYRDFRRAAAQRSLAMASGRGGDQRRLWEERTAALALPVVRRRYEMAEVLGAHLLEASARILPEGAGARVALRSRPTFAPGSEARYEQELTALYAAQQHAPGHRHARVGPSGDDLAIEIEGRDVLRYGSSGQLRALLTSAVLAEMTRLNQLKGRFPVLVIDDIDSDLDENRYGALLEALGSGAQVFAASSKPRLAFGSVRASGRYSVKGGVIAEA